MAVFLTMATICMVLYLLLLIYYRFAFVSIPTTKLLPKPATKPSTFISIIIPARNEAANISACIDAILQNGYPAQLFEILVVDDHSEDNTVSIVKKYEAQSVKLIQLKDFVQQKINAYKKKAIEVAIAQARGTLIITTDADCIVPSTWLQSMANLYEQKKSAFIAAPVAIDCGWHFIQIFQSVDFMTLQGITAAVVHSKQMTMCNGANMAYERAAFYEVGGFAGIDDIASGDDMLLMHKIYKRYPDRVLFLKSKDAIVKTAPVNTIQQFISQRIRWASKADKYDDKRILPVLVLVYFLNFLMVVLPILALFSHSLFTVYCLSFTMLDVWLWMLFFKIVVELFFLFPVASFFGKKSMLWFFPFLQPFHICYTLVAGWLGKFGKYTWKERRVS